MAFGLKIKLAREAMAQDDDGQVAGYSEATPHVLGLRALDWLVSEMDGGALAFLQSVFLDLRDRPIPNAVQTTLLCYVAADLGSLDRDVDPLSLPDLSDVSGVYCMRCDLDRRLNCTVRYVGQAGELDALAARFRELAAHAVMFGDQDISGELASIRRELSAALLGATVNYAPLRERVVVVADRGVALVPFGSLQGTDGQSLVAGHVPIVATSLRAFCRREEEAKPSDAHGLIVGDPAFGPAVEGVQAMATLPATAAECQEVASMLPGRLLLGQEASAERVRSLMADATFVHVATHGYIDPPPKQETFAAQRPTLRDCRRVHAARRNSLAVSNARIRSRSCSTGPSPSSSSATSSVRGRSTKAFSGTTAKIGRRSTLPCAGQRRSWE